MVSDSASGNREKGKRLFELGMQRALQYEADEAIDFYTQSIAASPNPAPYINRANLLAKRLRYREALEDLLVAQRLDRQQGNEFSNEIDSEIARAKLISSNYENGLRERLIADLRESDPRSISRNIFCASFEIHHLQWDYKNFDRPLIEFHFFNDIDNIKKFDSLSVYPEVEEFYFLYDATFVEMKASGCPNPHFYGDAIGKLHNFLCSYDEDDMRYLRRIMLYDIHEKLLGLDFDDTQGTFDSECQGVIREAELAR